jgi:hypothetical protein
MKPMPVNRFFLPADNRTMKAAFRLLCLALAVAALPQSFPAYAQESFELFIPEPERRRLAPDNPEPLPRKFREFSLGMTLDGLKTALAADTLFRFRGDRDVSFLPVREETLVETAGPSYIKRAYFQLSEGAVYIMSFSLDTRVMDHYSVYTSLVRKYGEPQSLSPGESVWENDETRVSVERPLTVKYIDKTVFNRLIENAGTDERRELLRREEFLDDF